MKLVASFVAAAVLAVLCSLALYSQEAQTPSPQTPAPPAGTTSPQSATPLPNPPQGTAAAQKAASDSSASKMMLTVPPPLPPALAHARDAYRSGQFDAAAAQYNAIISAGGPDVAGAYAGLARADLKLKKPADAFTAAQKAVSLDEHLATAHTALGEVYYRLGKMGEAEHELQTPLKEKIADPRGFYGLYRISLATSNYKNAKTALDVAHQLDPDDPEIRRAWLGTLSLKERMKALQQYLSGQNNDDAEAREHLAQMLVVLQDEANRPMHGCRLVNHVTTTQTNLESLLIGPTRLRGYGLKVKFNDTTARLLLDTGAGGIVLNSKIAEKAGVERVVEQKVGGIGDKGAAGGYIGYAKALQIGELQFENCYVDVVDNKRSLDQDGLIGADVFAHFLVDIDFPNQKFKLSELPKLPDEAAQAATLDTSNTEAYHPHDRYIAPEMQSYTRIYRIGHMLLIPVSVNEHPTKLFLIDTGAFDNTITPAAARESTKIYADDRMHVKGISGEVKNVFMAEDVTLAFAHYKQKKTIVAFDLTNISDSAGTEVSGTLGFGMLLLLDIKIDYRDGLVDFSYDEHRFH
jgi:tetratricopeptide (TPR) repeat protein